MLRLRTLLRCFRNEVQGPRNPTTAQLLTRSRSVFDQPSTGLSPKHVSLEKGSRPRASRAGSKGQRLQPRRSHKTPEHLNNPGASLRPTPSRPERGPWSKAGPADVHWKGLALRTSINVAVHKAEGRVVDLSQSSSSDMCCFTGSAMLATATAMCHRSGRFQNGAEALDRMSPTRKCAPYAGPMPRGRLDIVGGSMIPHSRKPSKDNIDFDPAGYVQEMCQLHGPKGTARHSYQVNAETCAVGCCRLVDIGAVSTRTGPMLARLWPGLDQLWEGFDPSQVN